MKNSRPRARVCRASTGGEPRTSTTASRVVAAAAASGKTPATRRRRVAASARPRAGTVVNVHGCVSNVCWRCVSTRVERLVPHELALVVDPPQPHRRREVHPVAKNDLRAEPLDPTARRASRAPPDAPTSSWSSRASTACSNARGRQGLVRCDAPAPARRSSSSAAPSTARLLAAGCREATTTTPRTSRRGYGGGDDALARCSIAVVSAFGVKGWRVRGSDGQSAAHAGPRSHGPQLLRETITGCRGSCVKVVIQMKYLFRGCRARPDASRSLRPPPITNTVTFARQRRRRPVDEVVVVQVQLSQRGQILRGGSRGCPRGRFRAAQNPQFFHPLEGSDGTKPYNALPCGPRRRGPVNSPPPGWRESRRCSAGALLEQRAAAADSRGIEPASRLSASSPRDAAPSPRRRARLRDNRFARQETRVSAGRARRGRGRALQPGVRRVRARAGAQVPEHARRR